MNGWAILSVSRRDTATHDNRIVGKLEPSDVGDESLASPGERRYEVEIG